MNRGIILFFLLMLFFVSCRKEGASPAGEGVITFRTSGVETKAASNLAVGKTVRVVVYRSEAGAASADLDRTFVMTNTYEVLSDGSLKPCKVDASGNKIAGEAFDIQVPVFDGATKYLDFYAYSPAIPLNDDNKTVTVTNGMDFMQTATYGKGITQSATNQIVTLPVMQRMCAALLFQYVYNNGSVTLTMQIGNEYPTNRKLGFNIDNLYASGTYTLGDADIVMPTDNVVSRYEAPDGLIYNPTTPSVDKTKLTGEIYILPGAANNTVAKNSFSMRFDINYSITTPATTANGTVMSYPSTDGSTSLVKGTRTKFNMETTYVGPSTVNLTIINTAIVQWDDGGTTTINL